MKAKDSKAKGRATGPKTAGGRARSARNAIKHGLTARLIPPHELAEFEHHRQGLLAELGPAGRLEQDHAERAILHAWHLQRAERWDASGQATRRRRSREHALYDQVSYPPHRASRPIAPASPVNSLDLAGCVRALVALTCTDVRPDLDAGIPAHSIIEPLNRAAAMLRAFASEPMHPYLSDLKLPARSEVKLLGVTRWWFACHESDLGEGAAMIDDEDQFKLSATTIAAAQDDPSTPWEGESLEGAWSAAEAFAPTWTWELNQPWPPADAIRQAADRVEGAIAHALALVARAELLLSDLEGYALLTPEPDLARLQRHASHHEKAYYRALHELEALQERRAGGSAPLVRVQHHAGPGVRLLDAPGGAAAPDRVVDVIPNRSRT